MDTPGDAAPWVAPDAPAPGNPGPGDAGPGDAGAVSAPRHDGGPAGRAAPEPFRIEVTGIAGILDRGFGVLRARPSVVLGAVAVLVVPVTVLGGLATGAPVGTEASSPLPWEVGDDEVAWLGVLGAIALDMLATFFAGLVVARVTAAWFAGTDVRLRAAFSGLPMLSGLVAFVLVSLAQLVGLLVCLVGVLVPLAFFMAVAPVLAVERVGAVASLARSWRLASRRPFHMIGLLAAVLLVAIMLTVALTVVPWLLMDPLPEPVRTVVRFGLVATSRTVLTAFTAAVATVAYLQLRARTEGLDLELEATDVLSA